MHLKFSYKKVAIEDENMVSFKQMKFQRYLPKKGFLNIQIEKVTNFKSLLECFDFESHSAKVSNREFYTSFRCTPFFEDEDLDSLFDGFQTVSTYGKLAYGLNYLKNYPITMNSAILEYFQTKKMRVDLLLNFDENNENSNENIKNNENNESCVENIKNNEDTFVLGSCEIPLIGLLINANGLINEEFCLSNESLQFSDVFVKVNLTLTEKPAILSADSSINQKAFGLIAINIIEVIYDETTFEDKKAIFFSLNFKRKILKTGKLLLKKEDSSKGFAFLPDVNFMLNVENTQELLLQPLEIQILTEEQENFGYINLDLSELIKKVLYYIKNN